MKLPDVPVVEHERIFRSEYSEAAMRATVAELVAVAHVETVIDESDAERPDQRLEVCDRAAVELRSPHDQLLLSKERLRKRSQF